MKKKTTTRRTKQERAEAEATALAHDLTLPSLPSDLWMLTENHKSFVELGWRTSAIEEQPNGLLGFWVEIPTPDGPLESLRQVHRGALLVTRRR